ncbi:MAG: DMT family transporter [Bacillota bacterium]
MSTPTNREPSGQPVVSTTVLMLIPMLIWSTVFPLSKLLLAVLPAATMAAVRFLIGGLCLLLYASWSLGWPTVGRSLRKHWLDYVLLGLTGIFLNNLLQNMGLRLAAATSTSLLGASGPIFSTLLAALFLGEVLTKRKLFGLGVAVAGIYLVTTNGRLVMDWQSQGNLLAVASSVSYSVYTIMSKRSLEQIEPLLVVTWSTLLGGVMLLATALVSDGSTAWSSISWGLWLNLFYLSTIPTSVAVVAYFDLLKRVQASQAASAFFLVPVFATIWAVGFLGETLSWAMLVGGCLIIAGVWFTMSRDIGQSPKSKVHGV